MIKFNWKRVRDGEPLAKIQVTHTLSREQLAGALIAGRQPVTYDDLEELSRAQVERDIRRLLTTHADKLNWWRDDYEEDYEEQPAADEVEAWAKGQGGQAMRRMVPTGCKAGGQCQHVSLGISDRGVHVRICTRGGELHFTDRVTLGIPAQPVVGDAL